MGGHVFENSLMVVGKVNHVASGPSVVSSFNFCGLGNILWSKNGSNAVEHFVITTACCLF